MAQLTRIALAGVLAFLLIFAVLAVVPPAGASDRQYVALGDSYSSGVGTRSYLRDGTSCRRSTYAYPARIARARGLRLDFRACSGATIPDVRRQLGTLSPATAYVTVSVGGNDAGFSGVLIECAKPGWLSHCGAAVDRARARVRDVLPRQIAALYAAIRSRAPKARVVVVGYPRLFHDEDCNAGTWFSPRDRSRLNGTADLLDAMLATAAAARGFAFADPTGLFAGHAVCDDPEWLNGLSRPLVESFHPNREGQARGYTPLVSRLLGSASDR